MYFKEDLTPEDCLDNELVKWTIMKGPCRYSTLLGEHGQEGAPEDFKEWGFRRGAPRNTLVLQGFLCSEARQSGWRPISAAGDQPKKCESDP